MPARPAGWRISLPTSSDRKPRAIWPPSDQPRGDALPAGDLKGAVRGRALALGFDAVGFARAEVATAARQEFLTYLSQGFHGDMDWLAAKAERRSDPQTLWPEARTVIVLGQNYGPAQDPLALLERRDRAAISVYARNADYHDHIKKRLKALDRKSVVKGKSVAVRVDLGGRRIIKKKK